MGKMYTPVESVELHDPAEKARCFLSEMGVEVTVPKLSAEASRSSYSTTVQYVFSALSLDPEISRESAEKISRLVEDWVLTGRTPSAEERDVLFATHFMPGKDLAEDLISAIRSLGNRGGGDYEYPLMNLSPMMTGGDLGFGSFGEANLKFSEHKGIARGIAFAGRTVFFNLPLPKAMEMARGLWGAVNAHPERSAGSFTRSQLLPQCIKGMPGAVMCPEIDVAKILCDVNCFWEQLMGRFGKKAVPRQILIVWTDAPNEAILGQTHDVLLINVRDPRPVHEYLHSLVCSYEPELKKKDHEPFIRAACALFMRQQVVTDEERKNLTRMLNQALASPDVHGIRHFSKFLDFDSVYKSDPEDDEQATPETIREALADAAAAERSVVTRWVTVVPQEGEREGKYLKLRFLLEDGKGGGKKWTMVCRETEARPIGADGETLQGEFAAAMGFQKKEGKSRSTGSDELKKIAGFLWTPSTVPHEIHHGIDGESFFKCHAARAISMTQNYPDLSSPFTTSIVTAQINRDIDGPWLYRAGIRKVHEIDGGSFDPVAVHDYIVASHGAGLHIFQILANYRNPNAYLFSDQYSFNDLGYLDKNRPNGQADDDRIAVILKRYKDFYSKKGARERKGSQSGSKSADSKSSTGGKTSDGKAPEATRADYDKFIGEVKENLRAIVSGKKEYLTSDSGKRWDREKFLKKAPDILTDVISVQKGKGGTLRVTKR